MLRHTTALISLCLLAAACTAENASDTGSKKTETEIADNKDFQTAEKLKKDGKLLEAAQIYEQLAKVDNKSVDAHIELAAISRKMGYPEAAVEVMVEAVKRQPDNYNASMQLGYALADAKRYQEAVNLFDGLIALHPNNAQAYGGKAIAFDKSGNHLAAQELYKQSLAIAPQSLSAQNNLAMSLILNNQLSQAIPMLEKLMQDYPENKTIRHNLALAYGLMGNNEKAYQLNIKDLSAQQAEENTLFYDYYAKVRNKLLNSTTDSGMTIGFTETPEEKKHSAPTIAKAEKKAVLKDMFQPESAAAATSPATAKPELAKEEPETENKPELKPSAAPEKSDEAIITKTEPQPIEKPSEPETEKTEATTEETVKPEASYEKPKGTVLETSGENTTPEYPSQKRH